MALGTASTGWGVCSLGSGGLGCDREVDWFGNKNHFVVAMEKDRVVFESVDCWVGCGAWVRSY